MRSKINRLLKPRPPEIYRTRKKRGLYVPARLDTASTALLVAIQILQDEAPASEDYIGHTKDELYTLAENLDIKKDPFSGGTTQTGPYRKSKSFDSRCLLVLCVFSLLLILCPCLIQPTDYDGWSSMSKLLQPGDPPLVIKKKRNREDRFSLSKSSDVSGIALARAMHKWCHQAGICRCKELGHEYNL